MHLLHTCGCEFEKFMGLIPPPIEVRFAELFARFRTLGMLPGLIGAPARIVITTNGF